MATYKVIQDIEAEDKFVGPLTLKQFVFAMFGALFGYLSFYMLTRGLSWALVITLPPMFFGFFMAVPWSSEQPTDLWVLAKIRFRMKPQKRIWDQAGIQDLVTITAPKKEDKPRTKNFSETEVRSRLKALAETIDSRGWIIKTGPMQEYAGTGQDDDRLVNPELLPSQSAASEAVIPDMMDEGNDLDSMILEHDQARKAEIYEKMDQARYGAPLEPGQTEEPTVLPPSSAPATYDEKQLSDTLRAKRSESNVATENMHTISSTPAVSGPADDTAQDDAADDVPATRAAQTDAPDESTEPETTEVEKAQASMTEPLSPDIIGLAGNNDWNVSTIARHAGGKDAENEPQEVVINLH
ncbi:MAG TPA: PrgI family protein [Candidatus Saccharimonadales bacterium]|nr:PrgI family protein [Candidatus Saccharimonadales bacterium]